MLAAYYMGHPGTESCCRIALGLSAAVATCAGVLLAPITVYSNVGLVPRMKAVTGRVSAASVRPGAVVAGA